MKKSIYLLFTIAVLTLVVGRMPTHGVAWPTSSHAASIMQVQSGPTGPEVPDPIGDPDGPNGPDGGPDGQGDGGPGAV